MFATRVGDEGFTSVVPDGTRCKSDRASDTTINNVNIDGTISFITRKVLIKKKLYYNILKSYRGQS